MNQPLHAEPLAAKAPRRYFQTAQRRCYTTVQICDLLNLPRSTFFRLKAEGKLPLVELTPRLGRIVRYQAGPIDRYLSGSR